MSDDTIDLDIGERLSARAPSGCFIATRAKSDTYRALVADFGAEADGSAAYVIGDVDAFESRRGRKSTAITEAECVAWLLTNREELIRLARVGQAYERGRK